MIQISKWETLQEPRAEAAHDAELQFNFARQVGLGGGLTGTRERWLWLNQRRRWRWRWERASGCWSLIRGSCRPWFAVGKPPPRTSPSSPTTAGERGGRRGVRRHEGKAAGSP